MDPEQYTALYLYEPSRVQLMARRPLILWRLEFANQEFQTTKVTEFQERTFELEPGVYGWYDVDPVALQVSGKAVVMTMRRVGKDPWPPPPPPPPTPDFAQQPEAQQRWALHWDSRDGQRFMPKLAE